MGWTVTESSRGCVESHLIRFHLTWPDVAVIADSVRSMRGRLARSLRGCEEGTRTCQSYGIVSDRYECMTVADCTTDHAMCT